MALFKAKLDRANAEREMAHTGLEITDIKALFDGIVGSLPSQVGSLIKEGDMLATLSDNSEMWVYFKVPDKRYLEYMAARKQNKRKIRKSNSYCRPRQVPA